MGWRHLAVIFVLSLGCTWVSAQTYQFGFAAADGTLYCDYLDITVGSGVALGIDNMSVCGDSTSPSLFGFVSSNPQLAPFGIVTSGVDLADDVPDWQAQAYTNSQVILHTALKCNAQTHGGKYKGKYGWLLLAESGGMLYGDNYGYLSCTIPKAGDEEVVRQGPMFKNLASSRRQ